MALLYEAKPTYRTNEYTHGAPLEPRASSSTVGRVADIAVLRADSLNDDMVAEIRAALTLGDPQLDILAEHIREGSDHVQNNPATRAAFLARMNDAFAGYARLHQHAPTDALWLLDMILPTSLDENGAFVAAALINAARQFVGSKTIEWWVRDGLVNVATAMAPAISQLAPGTKLTLRRRVERMERPLNEFDVFNTVTTRAFALADAAEIVRINNTAFHDHADRSDMTATRLLDDLAHMGNRFEDLRVFEAEPGVIGGFVWLKEHNSGVGEIYVLALDDPQRGKHYGRKLLDTGLAHLRHQFASRRALLYVESTNTHAIALYAADLFVNVNRPLVSFELA